MKKSKFKEKWFIQKWEEYCMAHNYKFTFGYVALKMLGKTLYSNPFAALSELIANGFDANADKIWVYLDIRNKQKSIIEVIDNGYGMSDNDIIEKYLKVGQINRNADDPIMMGRKGIGKLAAFYLSNNYYLATKTVLEKNIYNIDFTKCEDDPNCDDYMDKVDEVTFINKDIYEKMETGTAVILDNVSFVGYGEKTFSVLNSELSEYFAFKDDSKKIYLKIVSSDDNETSPFMEVRKYIAFKNMTKIYYNVDETTFEDVIRLDGTEITNAEKVSKDSKIIISVEKITRKPRKAEVNGKEIELKPYGWIGIHQTINREKGSLNDPNFINSRFYRFNKVRIYVRDKLALENILPNVHNTQYYANYIEGEIHCDELDDNDLPDIASSSRQDLDKNDDRVIALTEFIADLVKDLVNFKNNQTRNDEQRQKRRQKNAVSGLSEQIGEVLSDHIDNNLTNDAIEEIKHSINNSFERVGGIAKTDYKLFFSHTRADKAFSDFIYYYLINCLQFDKEMIFYTSCDGGIDESVKALEKQINDNLTSANSYACFFICSKRFKQSDYCMFEGGAAWAVKQDSVIGLMYNNYDKDVPAYLKSMKNKKVKLNTELDRNTYIALVDFINSMIKYLNKNYLEENEMKPLITEVSIPNDLELSQLNKNALDYYNKDILAYWNYYVKGNVQR